MGALDLPVPLFPPDLFAIAVVALLSSDARWSAANGGGADIAPRIYRRNVLKPEDTWSYPQTIVLAGQIREEPRPSAVFNTTAAIRVVYCFTQLTTDLDSALGTLEPSIASALLYMETLVRGDLVNQWIFDHFPEMALEPQLSKYERFAEMQPEAVAKSGSEVVFGCGHELRFTYKADLWDRLSKNQLRPA
jgi:hypothetical protein